MKNIHIILMGGTIATVVTEDGSKVISLVDFCRHLKELGEFDITINEFRKLSGNETRMPDVVDLAKEIERVIREENADGVVVVQGTNVMEEIVFALDLLLDTDVPIVCTGAMRVAAAPSADGASNLIDAVIAAASDSMRGLGVTLVMNGEIHGAQFVRKEHSLNTNTFHSEFCLGYMAERVPSLRCRPIRRRIPWLDIDKNYSVEVLLYTTYFDDSGALLDHVLSAGYEGLVIEGTGGGGVPEWIKNKILSINNSIPCVLSHRTGHGDIVVTTYGKNSKQIQMYNQGVALSGQLDGRKSRVLLMLLLMSGCTRKQIMESFSVFSKQYGSRSNYVTKER